MHLLLDWKVEHETQPLLEMLEGDWAASLRERVLKEEGATSFHLSFACNVVMLHDTILISPSSFMHLKKYLCIVRHER